LADSAWIRTCVGVTPTGFQDQRLRPLGQLSVYLVQVTGFEPAVPYLASRYVGRYTTHALFQLLTPVATPAPFVVNTIAACRSVVNPQFCRVAERGGFEPPVPLDTHR
jgi:hypothetical protein